jgi:SH3-like domain-containing protein
MTRTSLAATLALALACSGQKGAPAPPPAGPPDASVAAGGEADAAYVTAATPLRRQPTDAAKVPGATPKASLANVVALLQRGEKVTVLESREDWARVRASDETVGWMKKGLLLPALGVTEATLLQPADAFDRPDLLALNARRKIEPGTLVLVVRDRELFSEINLSSGANAWVLSDRLSRNPRDVMVAKLSEKARWLVKAGKADEAKEVLALARSQFADVPLVQVLAAELGEGEPDGGVPEPGSPGGPPPSPWQQR